MNFTDEDYYISSSAFLYSILCFPILYQSWLKPPFTRAFPNLLEKSCFCKCRSIFANTELKLFFCSIPDTIFSAGFSVVVFITVHKFQPLLFSAFREQTFLSLNYYILRKDVSYAFFTCKFEAPRLLQAFSHQLPLLLFLFLSYFAVSLLHFYYCSLFFDYYISST